MNGFFSLIAALLLTPMAFATVIIPKNGQVICFSTFDLDPSQGCEPEELWDALPLVENPPPNLMFTTGGTLTRSGTSLLGALKTRISSVWGKSAAQTAAVRSFLRIFALDNQSHGGKIPGMAFVALGGLYWLYTALNQQATLGDTELTDDVIVETENLAQVPPHLLAQVIRAHTATAAQALKSALVHL